MPNASGKLNICVDFDGVIHSYTKWKGFDVFDDPIPGASEALQYLKAQGHTIILHTTRSVTPKLVHWLADHQVPIDFFNENPLKVDNALDPRKPLADIYIDDRGIQFNGDWPSMVHAVECFKPWYKR